MAEGLKELLGEFVFDKEGDKVPVERLAENDLIGIYFSAHWCGPCRHFTPKLADFYNNVLEAGKKFEIVFVSSDHDQTSYDDYYAEMPWLTVGFNSDKGESLSERFEVSGIPTLVLVDSNGEEKDRDARMKVEDDPEGENFPWDLV